jgi:O6-methylguanine-DNA--protein-cysteine methyltransferase
VVSASGIGGYAGAVDGKLLDQKRWLLAHEGVHL